MPRSPIGYHAYIMVGSAYRFGLPIERSSGTGIAMCPIIAFRELPITPPRRRGARAPQNRRA